MADFKRILASIIAATAWLVCGIGHASDFGARQFAEDSKEYFTAPLHWDADDWTYFAASVVAIGVAHGSDDDVRARFAGGSPAQDSSMKDALPAGLLFVGTLAGAALTDNQDGYGEAMSMAEAGVLSGVATLGLKRIFGRQRPRDTSNPDVWFTGGESFPSGHATVAFAIGAVFAESGSDRYRWMRRTIGYGMAAGTAYLRIKDNAHWLSDTVAGAALGVATAKFVVERRDGSRERAAMSLMPLDGGVMISYSMPLH